ncbi:MAG TPA: NAD(P)(+) transhydrogenase (Re/Si-specific) subunit beta [Longimicrobiaceae bacterium]|nr:NAD(P)(+) transhydrogenase (Re/Si-specific) subunit beta [Longimicrobiaceae bacterium]
MLALLLQLPEPGGTGATPLDLRETGIQLTYLASCVLFILGLYSLTKPARAQRGMQLAALGMLLAIIGTLLHRDIVRFEWIVGGLLVGTAIGYPLGMFVPMTAMPQRIAVSHMFGAMAATLVGVAEYQLHHGTPPHATMAALGFEVLFGALTITGSFMAFGKLQGFVTGTPVTWKGQNAINLTLFAATFGIFVYLVVSPGHPALFYAMVAMSLAIGVLMVLPIGGADMPVVVSLLNSYAGLAASATGFAIGNTVLIICGALDGASGFLLSVLMSKAMNRSFGNVLFGAFGAAPAGVAAAAEVGDRTVRSVSAEDVAVQLAYAREVIVVPGYGMAVAQCQHQVRELATLVEKRGGEFKYAIHPVAGRMPGHMNVLLAEANVPYDRLYDLEEINDQFEQADVVLVIGANDVVNPAAKKDPGSPIYGMPILNVDEAKSIIVLKRSMAAGFSGVENELFFHPRTAMLFGDAKSSLQQLISDIKEV